MKFHSAFSVAALTTVCTLAVILVAHAEPVVKDEGTMSMHMHMGNGMGMGMGIMTRDPDHMERRRSIMMEHHKKMMEMMTPEERIKHHEMMMQHHKKMMEFHQKRMEPANDIDSPKEAEPQSEK